MVILAKGLGAQVSSGSLEKKIGESFGNRKGPHVVALYAKTNEVDEKSEHFYIGTENIQWHRTAGARNSRWTL